MIMVDDQGLQFGMNGRNRDGCLSASFSGRVTVKVVPEPAALVTSIVPPIKSTIFLVIAIPRPVPSILSVFDVWERSKGVNSAAEIPGPCQCSYAENKTKVSIPCWRQR